MSAIILSALFALVDPEGRAHLDALVNAQKANRDLYPKGKLTADVRWGQVGEPTLHHYAQCRVVWMRPDNLFVTLRKWEDHTHQPDGTEANPIIQSRILTRTHDYFYLFAASIPRVIVSPPTRSELPVEIDLEPRASWYKPIGFGAVDWLTLANGWREWTITSRKNTTGSITVLLEEPTIRAKVQLEYSPAHHGNILSYAMDFPSTNSDYHVTGTSLWAASTHGSRLAEATQKSMTKRNGRTFELYYDVKILSFDPTYTPDAKEFALTAMNIPKGTFVSDMVLKKNWHYGGTPVQSTVDRLPSLIQTMQSRGFARNEH